MSRQVDIVATSTSTKYLLFGFEASELSSFKLQMWITKTGARAVDWLQSLSLGFCSYIGGNIYLHNSDEVPRCELFGEKKDCKIGVVVNEGGTQKKILDSLGIQTDSNWEVESLIIPPDLNYPNGMDSRIPSSFFKKREGGIYSEFLRNSKTTSSTVKAIELLNGEPLRGSSAYFILKNTSDDKVQLWEVQVNMTISK
jgi:hypothetical protein